MKTRKLFSLVLTALMLLALTLPALAEGEYSITITNTAEGHTYEAYQIFKGDLLEKDEKKVLSNVEWGDGINGENLLTALKAETSFGTDFSKCETAADVARVLAQYDTNAEKTQTFAKLAANNLKKVSASSTWDGTNKKYTISGLSAGYYLVKDKDQSSNIDAYTRYILKVVGNVTVNAKVDVPTIDKKIQEGQNTVTVNEASIGDKVEFVVTSNVPDMTGYSKYYFVVNDTMSKGLTFNNDVTITVGNKTLEANTDFTVASESVKDTGATTIKIVFKNFFQYKDQKGAAITIKYSGTLNEKAEIGVNGNENKVDLVYSNNPNYNYTGSGDEPGKDEPTGKTPEIKTETFTTKLTITKNDDNSKILTGAAFRLTGEGVNIVIVTCEKFEVDENGEYWKLKDGTYTTMDPNGDSIDSTNYESTETKYKKVTEVIIDQDTEKNVFVEGYVNSEGKLTFTGLGAGKYKLEEIVTPAGYNTIETIEFTISFDATNKKFSVTDNNDIHVGETTNTLTTTVVNESGSTLPSTGGMGTTLFYVLGGLLAVGAGVLLATRKKMSAEK